MKQKTTEPQARQTPELRELLLVLHETKESLRLVQDGFERATDPDLITFYLCSIDALRAKHSYLSHRIKALSEPLPT